MSIALLSGLATAPDGAWRGDLLMVGAALCMALYSIWSKPFIRRSGPIPFTTLAMAAGAAVLVILSLLCGSFAPVEAFGPPQWFGVLYLGAFGSALTFYLWAFALARTTPTLVAISVTVNPIAASLVGATLLGEPLRWNLGVGIVTVFVGIWIATRQSRRDAAAYSTSSTLSGPPPNAFCASAACMNGSRSPSSTPAESDVETPVRRSLTI